MPRTRIELTIMAADGLKNVSLFRGSMDPFAVAFVHPFAKRFTSVSRKGGTDPVWNHSMEIPLEDGFLLDPAASLTIQVFNQSAIHTSLIGATQLWLPGFFRYQVSQGNDEAGILTLQLFRPSGRAHGVIRISLKLVGDDLSTLSRLFDSGVPANGIPAMPTPDHSHKSENYSYRYPHPYIPPAYSPYYTGCCWRNNSFLLGLVSGAIAGLLLGAIF